MNKRIFDVIHKKIVYIWENLIEEDYNKGWLLKEDTLKASLYYHLRSELGTFLDENNIRIFTEFTDGVFYGKRKRPDMVIATVDMDSERTGYFGKYVKDCIAVIEIKFKNSYGVDAIYADYEKIEGYLNDLDMNGHIYMATIWENEDEPTTWIRKNAAWAKEKVTELNASYIKGSDGKLQFYVYEH